MGINPRLSLESSLSLMHCSMSVPKKIIRKHFVRNFFLDRAATDAAVAERCSRQRATFALHRGERDRAIALFKAYEFHPKVQQWLMSQGWAEEETFADVVMAEGDI